METTWAAGTAGEATGFVIYLFFKERKKKKKKNTNREHKQPGSLCPAALSGLNFHRSSGRSKKKKKKEKRKK